MDPRPPPQSATAPGPAHPREGGLTLPEEEARRLLLVRAFEEADEQGRWLGPRQRERASVRARAEAPEDEQRFLIERARRLSAELAASTPAAEQLAAGASWAPPAAWVAALAFLAGLASNALGPLRHINVLAFPLLGLLVWNLAVYVGMGVLALRGRARGRRTGARASSQGASGWMRWAARRAWPSGGDAAELAPVIERFATLWRVAAAPLLAARLRAALHLGALAAAAGVVAGMYLRGLAFEYRVTWESTFLDAGAAQMLLRIALAPALLLTGQELPPLETLRAPADAPAAPWIHLYALTALPGIGLPRLWLHVRDRRRAAALSRALPLGLEEPYFRRLLTPQRGASLRVLVVPYSYSPDARALSRLKELLHDSLGARAQIEHAPVLEYGAESAQAPQPAHEAGGRALLVLLLPLAQAPEVEVHARFLDELRAAERAPLLVVLDSSTYRRRLEQLAERDERLDERRRAWERVVREAGLQVVHVDLDSPAGENAAGLLEAVWPSSPRGEARS